MLLLTVSLFSYFQEELLLGRTLRASLGMISWPLQKSIDFIEVIFMSILTFSDPVPIGLTEQVNQIGTVTESIEAVKMAKQAGWGVMTSHRRLLLISILPQQFWGLYVEWTFHAWAKQDESCRLPCRLLLMIWTWIYVLEFWLEGLFLAVERPKTPSLLILQLGFQQ